MNDDLQNVLASLASKLGTSADKLWPIIVAKQRTDWVAEAGICILGVALSLIFWRTAAWYSKEHGWDFAENGWAIALFIFGAITVIGIGIVIANVGQVIYPEASAIEAILGHK